MLAVKNRVLRAWVSALGSFAPFLLYVSAWSHSTLLGSRSVCALILGRTSIFPLPWLLEYFLVCLSSQMSSLLPILLGNRKGRPWHCACVNIIESNLDQDMQDNKRFIEDCLPLIPAPHFSQFWLLGNVLIRIHLHWLFWLTWQTVARIKSVPLFSFCI